MPISPSSPRVVGENRADFYSLETLLASPQFAGKQGEDLALAIYNYFTSTNDGTWHGWPHHENRGMPRVRTRVTDPVKMLNVYGWMICGQCSHVLAGIYRAAGFQYRELGLYGHNVCEVFYENDWHIFDVDMWTWFRTPQGKIASAYDLTQAPHDLIVKNTNKSNPCNLPDRTIESYAEMYTKVPTLGQELKAITPRFTLRAHTMDFHLRPGETLIRTESALGRFHVPEEWRRIFLTASHEWPGQPRERFVPFRTYGNGQRIYAPNLSNQFEDFDAGVWERQGLMQDEKGLIGPGSATFRMQSPYMFAGVADLKTNPYKFSDGVWISIAGSCAGKGSMKLEVQDAEERWATVFTHPGGGGAFDRKVDVTDIFEARYDVLIRVSLEDGARLDRFKFEGYFMNSPRSLPRLQEGDNRMQVRCLDKHHEATVPWTRTVDFRAGADLSAQWKRAENWTPGSFGQWQTIAPKEAGKPVRVEYEFSAPAGRKFAWAYVVIQAIEGKQDQPPQSALLEWSADGQRWQPFAADAIPATRMQWDATVDGEIRPPRPLEKISLRITCGTAITAVQFTGHLLEKIDPRDALRIVHRWNEGLKDQNVQHSFEAPPGASSYIVHCGTTPREHAIEMSVPSRRK